MMATSGNLYKMWLTDMVHSSPKKDSCEESQHQLESEIFKFRTIISATERSYVHRVLFQPIREGIAVVSSN